MVVDVVMPKMGESIMEGTILEWYKKVGDSIERILIRGEAVRFAPVSSQDAQNDLQEFKILLKEADDGWL